MIPRIRFLGAILALGLVFLGTTGQVAKADLYYLTTANQPFAGGPPYASVDITANSGAGTVTFVVTALTSATDKIGEFGFNTTVSLTAANFTTVPSNWTPTGPGGNTMDGYGNFTWSVGSSANADRVHSATIVISGLSAADATIANFVQPSTGGNPGHLFAVHLFGTDSTGAALTGFADGAQLAPEPSTLAIAGLGALGFLGYGLRRRLKK